MEDRKHSDNSFLTGLVLGGVIGAGLTLLFSKEEGEEGRKILIKKGKTLLSNLGEIIDEEKQADLKQHWVEEPASTVKKAAQKFFHRNGKKLS